MEDRFEDDMVRQEMNELNEQQSGINVNTTKLTANKLNNTTPSGNPRQVSQRVYLSQKLTTF